LNLNDLADQACSPIPPHKIREKVKRKTLCTLPAAIILIIVLYRTTHQLVIGVLPIIPTTIYILYDLLKLYGWANDRRKGVEAELPFAATLLAMAANHSTPTLTLRSTVDMASLKNSSREYFNILKHAALYHLTPAQAANLLARNHPSGRFQSFLRTISSAERGLGDPYSSLSDVAKAELENTQHQTELAAEKLGVASSAVLMLFAVLPLTLTVFTFITGQSSLVNLAYIITLPALILVDFLIDQAYPAMLKYSPPRPPSTLIIGCITALVLAIVLLKHVPIEYMFAAVLLCATTPVAVYYRLTQKAYGQLVQALPHISRDIAEEAKKGFPPMVALHRIINSAKYSRGLVDVFLVRKRPAPFIVQAYGDMLRESERLGASSGELESVAEAFNAVANTYSSYRSKSSFFKITAYASVGILTAATVAVTSTMKRLSLPQSTPTIVASGLLPNFKPQLEASVYAVTVINSYLLGLLAGKAHSGSLLLGLLDAAIAVLIAVVIIVIGGVV
jgi:hypothetical protein